MRSATFSASATLAALGLIYATLGPDTTTAVAALTIAFAGGLLLGDT